MAPASLPPSRLTRREAMRFRRYLPRRRLALLAGAAGAGIAAAAIVVLIAALVAGNGPPAPHRGGSPSAPSGSVAFGDAPATVAPAPAAATTVPGAGTAADSGGSGCSVTAGPDATNPVALRIPAIGVSTSVIGLGLNADHTLQVPPLTYAGTHEAGWYRLGPAPGDVGAAIIVGHVDSTSGPAVFYRLGSLAPGDTVQVIAANCETSVFDITSVEEYSKSNFPTERVYGTTSDPELRLITCGGVFDPATGHYLSNIVAYAKTVHVA